MLDYFLLRNLLKELFFGAPKPMYHVKVEAGKTVRVTEGKRWKIVDCMIRHITGTTSDLEVRDFADHTVTRYGVIDGIYVSGYYSGLIHSWAYLIGADWNYTAVSLPTGQVMFGNDGLYLAGGAGAYAIVTVEESEG